MERANQTECGKICVVVPCRNSAEWLPDTLQSIADQTFSRQSLEVRVVDDASTDSTAEIAERRLRTLDLNGVVHRIDCGRGPSAARNVGWRASKAEWIQFLDSDDLLHPEKLSRQMAVAAISGDDAAVVYSDWQRLSEVNGEWLPSNGPFQPRIGEDAVADLLHAANFIATGSQIYARRWLERVDGWNERHRMIEDVDLLIRVAISGGRFIHASTPSPVFFYRSRGDSLSKTSPREFAEGCVRNARLAAEHFRRTGGMNALRKERLADVFLMASRQLYELDPTVSDSLLREVETTAPGCLPSATPALRRLSGLVGLRRAERIARTIRSLKRWRLRRDMKGARP